MMASPSLVRRSYRREFPPAKSGRNKSKEKENNEDNSFSEDEVEKNSELLKTQSLSPKTPNSHKRLSTSSEDISVSPDSSYNRTPPVIPQKTCQTANHLWLGPLHVVLLVALLLVALLPVAWFCYSEWTIDQQVDQQDAPDRFQKFCSSFPTFVLKFPNQAKHSWKVVKAAVKPILQDKEPSQPAVVVLVATEEAEQTLSCFSRQLSQLIEDQFEDIPASFLHVDSRRHRQETAGSFKQYLELKAQDGFKNGSHTFLIENIQDMQGESVLMLHGLCDDKNAPYKRFVYLLTVIQPNGKELDLNKFEVSSLWKNELKEDIRSGLESRIGALKAGIEQESEKVLGTQCSVLN